MIQMKGIEGEYAGRILDARKEKGAEKARDMEEFGGFLKKAEGKCPYSALAKDGIIEYNGVIFVCDYKRNTISLGDVSDPRQVLNISLPSGGNLKVNVNCFGDLSRAAGMFTPEDLNAILRAIHQYQFCVKKQNEMEEETFQGLMRAQAGAEENETEENETEETVNS